MDATDIARLIRHERKRRGLTLEELAEKVGLTAGALSHIENGRRLPAPENAVAIARALGFDEALALAALDEAHRERRYESLSSSGYTGRAPSAPESTPSDDPRRYRKRPIGELFEVDALQPSAPPPAPLAISLSSSDSLLRDTARWSEDTSERLEALESMADTASRAIRTLRGLLEDEDPAVRREARRLLRELDVRLPDETSGG